MAGNRRSRKKEDTTPIEKVAAPSKTSSVGVYNNSQRIVILKGVTQPKDGKQPKSFKTPLLPQVLNMVPDLMWKHYKANKQTQAMLDHELLLVNAKPTDAPKKEKVDKVAAAEAAKKRADEAVLKELENE